MAAPIPDKHYADFVDSMPSQKGRTLVITGTTSGTGFQAAKAIVSRGGTLLVLNRPSSRATAALEKLKGACAEGGTVEQVRIWSLEQQLFKCLQHAVWIE